MRTSMEWHTLHSNLDLSKAALPTGIGIGVDAFHLL